MSRNFAYCQIQQFYFEKSRQALLQAMRMSTTVLFIIVENGKHIQLTRITLNKLNKFWYIHILLYNH